MPRRSALVFDLDGTLIDSAPDLAAALNRVLDEEGLPGLPVAAVTRMVGDGAAKLVERGFAAAAGAPAPADGMNGAVLAPDRIAALTARFVGYYEAVAADLTRPYPEVPETLARLAADGYRLAVCTNKPEGPARAVLAALGLLRYFPVVQGGDSNPVRKPDPGHLHAVLAAMSAATADAVMIGDSPVDVATARAAGIPVIVHAHGYSRVAVDALAADAVFERFAMLPALLERATFG